MKSFDMHVKLNRGSVAFIQLNDDSVWEVGIILRQNILPDNVYEYNTYVMYRGNSFAFIDQASTVNPEVKAIMGSIVHLYALVISEDLLPLGKVEVLCYKPNGIEEYPEEE